MNQIDSWTILSWTDNDHLIKAINEAPRTIKSLSRGLLAALALATTVGATSIGPRELAPFAHSASIAPLSDAASSETVVARALAGIDAILAKFQAGNFAFPNDELATLAANAAASLEQDNRTPEQWADDVLANSSV